jgi:tetratricopeptide (TPR) repeat protein
VSSRGRVFALVLAAAALAAGLVVAGVLATRSDVPGAPKARAGRPPLSLYLGIRNDPEAIALNRAQKLYADKRYAEAARIFGRYESLEAQVGSALSAWPSGSVDRLEELQSEHPRSALVALHLGLALYWERRDADAVEAWRAARREQPDTPYAGRADDFLHPRFAPGLPRFVPSFPLPRRLRGLTLPQQGAALRAAASTANVRAKLLYGSYLQQLGKPLSAERQFAAAARLAPNDPDARVAAAVGLFDKARPARAFGRLGPLMRTFPRAQTVRFHLGLLLLWSAQLDEARRQLRLARAEDPRSLLGTLASEYLRAIGRVGSP